MNSNRKGRAGELELCGFLTDRGFPAHRNDQRHCGGRGNPDISAEGLERFHLECKRVEALDLGAALRQAVRDCAGRVPAVVHRRNREGWLVTLRLEDFLKEVGRDEGF